MTFPPPSRPRYWRKKIWAAAALWLAACYPLSVGPACYGRNRGWLGPDFWKIYVPIMRAFDGVPGVGASYDAYIHWWSRLGADHAASD
jgi:hypothetical protein